MGLHAGIGAEDRLATEEVHWQLCHLLLHGASGCQQTWPRPWNLHTALLLFNPTPMT